ncbi:DUF3072 domain-containing protein [Nocardioides sp. AX2bis]|uniref:DUF3072 domain-containing protein n=1 Tax=Nocardioides sp. AX2bis TaxID=2653157 RepID=UPI0012F083FD|nr:DUF3072 domain-containing protein [Nocardioides sp. AX2bis]VXB63165.1 transposase [Nocardioides sp. AX2bis]
MSDSNTGANPTDSSTDEVLGAENPSPSNAEKDTDDWVTGDEPMTGAQKSYLDTLAREAGETLPADLTKAAASDHIERLQSSTGRGA